MRNNDICSFRLSRSCRIQVLCSWRGSSTNCKRVGSPCLLMAIRFSTRVISVSSAGYLALTFHGRSGIYDGENVFDCARLCLIVLNSRINYRHDHHLLWFDEKSCDQVILETKVNSGGSQYVRCKNFTIDDVRGLFCTGADNPDF